MVGGGGSLAGVGEGRRKPPTIADTGVHFRRLRSRSLPVCSVTHSFDKYVLGLSFGSATVLGTGNSAENHRCP